MKILVTGWNGRNDSFIPKAVAKHLIAAGHEVDGWDYREDYLDPEVGFWAYYNIDQKHPKFGSPVSENPCPITKYDLVIHLGAESSTTETDVELVMKKNFDFSLWLLNQCQKHEIPLHYASSASVYGNTSHFQETGRVDPKTPYAWSKYMFDKIVLENLKTFKSPVLGFRYFNVYGNWLQEKHKGSQASVMSKWEHDIQNNMAIDLFLGSSEFKRDFIWINDVCKIHEELVDKKYSGIFNVGSGVATSFKHVAEIFERKFSKAINYIGMPDNLKCHYQRYTKADISKLCKIVDHKPITVDEYFDNHY